MGYERNSRGNYPGDYYGRDAAEDYGAGRDEYSSARDYAAAGRLGGGYGRQDQERGDYGRQDYGRQEYGYGRYEQRDRSAGQQRGWTGEERQGGYDAGYGRGGYDRGYDADRGGRDYSRGTERNRFTAERNDPYRQQRGSYGRRPQDHDDDRGFLARAGDEVRSWFGDEEAERRRERDARHDGHQGYGRDEHYQSWRSQQLQQFDRDYHEYRQENQSKFHNEFAAFRTERQSQRELLNKVEEHAEVLGSDGQHVGTVDKVRGDRIILTKNDQDAGGRHHSIPSRWLHSADGKTVTLRKTAAEAKQHWRDEEREEQQGQGRGAMFGDRDDRDQGTTGQHPTNLNRSFSGTY